MKEVHLHICCCRVQLLSHVQLFATPWTVARQAPLPMGILQARILEWVAMRSYIFVCVCVYIYVCVCVCDIYIYITYIFLYIYRQMGLPWCLRWDRISLQCRKPGFHPWVGKIPYMRAWQPTPIFLPGESPWTEEPGRLQSMRLYRVRDD